MKRKLTSLILAAIITAGTVTIASPVSAAESVNLWFHHTTVKQIQTDTVSSGMTSYHMYMAKNEIEDCQFFISPSENMDVLAEVTDFTNAAGDTVPASIYYEHYFMMFDGTMMPDAIPPVQEAISVKKGNSQGFYVKAKTTAETPAGEYTATVTVKSGDKVLKTAEITLTVWDFTLTDETPITVVSDVAKGSIYSSYGMNDGDGGVLYKTYYDFMLDNRVCSYTLPYDILSDEVDEYLDNPRVTGFIAGGDYNSTNTDDASIKAIYEKMSTNPDWADKAIWYYVDEPTEMGKLNQLKAAGEKLASLYPGYQMVAPFFFNIEVGNGKDQFEFMSDYLNIWCTKINAWTPIDTDVEGAEHMMSIEQIARYGDYASRVAKEVEEGDKSWVYYCWEPLGPYTTFDASRQTLEQRVALWQAMDNDATGLLYFTSTEWPAGYWRIMHKTNAGGQLVYGDGILIYSGHFVGIDEPISSMRLESLRDGIEDYIYLDMAKELVSEDVYEKLMDNISVSVVEWTDDSDLFYNTRVALGNLIESASGDERAEGIVFKNSADYSVSTLTGNVAGADASTTVLEILSSLENMNGVEILRDGTALAWEDTVKIGDKLVLKNEDGSVKYEYSVIFMGNANGDKNVNLSDVALMLQKVAMWDVTIDEMAADVNGDGNVNLSDISMMLQKIAGWDVKFTKNPVFPGKLEMVKKDAIRTFTVAEGQNGVAVNMKDGSELGVKFSVAEGEYAVSVGGMFPSWGDSYGEITVSLYKWDRDYATTVAASPIASETLVDFEDNLITDIYFTDATGKGVGAGEYLVLLHDGYDAGSSAGRGVGVWTYGVPEENSGLTVYYKGEVADFGPELYINTATAK